MLLLTFFIVFTSKANSVGPRPPIRLEVNGDTHTSQSECNYTADAGEKLVISGNVTVNLVGIPKVILYGDDISREKWNVKLQFPASVTLSVKTNFTITVIVPLTAYNKDYGIEIQAYVDSEMYTHAWVWITVKNGQPYEYSRTVYNYTAPEHNYIIAENILRDVYNPIRPESPNYSVWLKRQNLSMDEHVHVTLWQFSTEEGAGAMCTGSMPCWLPENTTTTFSWHQINPSISEVTYFVINVTTVDETQTLDFLNVTCIFHCPGDPDYLLLSEEICHVIPDTNDDHIIDIYDVTFVCIAYGKNWSQPDWSIYARADVDGNHIVDIYDVTYVCVMYDANYT
jgi:hypothetical protein